MKPENSGIKVLRNCLDDSSKSNISWHMALMKRHGMIDQKDIEEFSAELQEQLKEVNLP